jgi:hypothetical protein
LRQTTRLPGRPRSTTRPGRHKVSKLKRCCRLPVLRHPRQDWLRTAEECGRSAARDVRIAETGPGARLQSEPRTPAKIAALMRSTGLILAAEALTILDPEDYIDPLGAPPMLRRDGASAKPLTVYTVNAHSAMSRWSCRMCGFRRSRKVPSCLTSESEERETWTAESLRAASSNGEGFRTEFLFRKGCGRTRLRRSTF